MDDAKNDLVRSWLIKAERDLESARRLSSGDKPLFDTAAYHCQQAGEKAVKGFLIFHDQRVEKTHDIEVLLASAKQCESGFVLWEEAARRLTHYATTFRYPGNSVAPDADEFQQALRAAEDLFSYVCSLLPRSIADAI